MSRRHQDVFCPALQVLGGRGLGEVARRLDYRGGGRGLGGRVGSPLCSAIFGFRLWCCLCFVFHTNAGEESDDEDGVVRNGLTWCEWRLQTRPLRSGTPWGGGCQPLGPGNAETTPAGAPAAAADRKPRPDATCEGTNR